jgi:hypothetical protein
MAEGGDDGGMVRLAMVLGPFLEDAEDDLRCRGAPGRGNWMGIVLAGLVLSEQADLQEKKGDCPGDIMASDGQSNAGLSV